jgi:hypothetical protein
VFSNPEPWRGDRKHTSWIKIISHHKTWGILFITYLPPHTCFFPDFILQMAWRRNTRCDITLISGERIRVTSPELGFPLDPVNAPQLLTEILTALKEKL